MYIDLIKKCIDDDIKDKLEILNLLRSKFNNDLACHICDYVINFEHLENLFFHYYHSVLREELWYNTMKKNFYMYFEEGFFSRDYRIYWASFIYDDTILRDFIIKEYLSHPKNQNLKYNEKLLVIKNLECNSISLI